jgi:hypothetical protein
MAPVLAGLRGVLRRRARARSHRVPQRGHAGHVVPRRAAIVAIALAAEAALVAWAALSGTEEIRVSSSAAGLLAFGGAYLIQRSPDRVYHWHADDEAEEAYQSLVTHGLVAVIAARIFEAILVRALHE